MCRILVVDDDVAGRGALCALFALEGFATASAADGYQALAMMLKRRPDLIVSDIAMPKLDGLRLVELLRAQGLQVPVILLTARAVVRRHCANAVLSKPVDADELLRVVRTLVGEDASGGCAALCEGARASDVAKTDRSAGQVQAA